MRARVTPIEVGYGTFIVVVFALCFWMQMQLAINEDDIFYLFAAERLIQGGNFLSNIYDINPPLITVISIPPVIAVHLFSLSLPVAFIGYTYALIVLSLGLIWKLAPLRLDESRHFSALAFTLLAILLAIMPGHDFAQREHFVAIFSAPWICLVARRWSGSPVTASAAIACASFAAIGFFLKPFFLPLPALVLAIDLWRDRSPRRILSTDNFTLAFWGLCYLAAILLVFPGWLTIVADGSHTYALYRNSFQNAFGTALFLVLPTGFCLSFGLLFASQPRLRAIVSVLGLAVIASTFSPLVQNKDWNYHFIPLQIELGMLCGLVGLLAIRQWFDGKWPLAGVALLVACTGATISKNIYASINASFRYGTVAQVRNSQLYHVLRDKTRGGTMMSISNAGGPLAATLYAGVRPGTRFLAFLDLPYVVQNLPNLATLPSADGARVTRLDHFLKSAAVEDIRLYRPTIILFETSPKLQAMPVNFDLQGYFVQSPAFAAELAGYQLLSDSGAPGGVVNYLDRQFRVYLRR